MSSAEYDKLTKAVSDLGEGLMSFPQRDDGAYTDEELLRCQAFIVFSHAEVQVYLENVSRRILSEARERWSSGAAIDRVIASLATFRHSERVPIPRDPKKATGKGSIREIIEGAIKKHREAIDDNNGIKRANVAELLCPLGVGPDDLEEPLLIQLDQTGSRRGEMVHKSSRVSLRSVRDPFTVERKDVEDLLTEIRKFDAKLASLGLMSSRPAPPVAGVPPGHAEGRTTGP